MEYHEYINLSFKDKMIYKACMTIYEHDWSVRQAAKELELSSSTVYRWITEYLFYIDSELYHNLLDQLKRRKKK